MSETEKWMIELRLPSKKKLTREDLLFKVAVLTYCIDRRQENHGRDPLYAPLFMKKVTHDGKTTSVIVDVGEELEPDTVKVLERLKKYTFVDGRTVSEAEWKARASLFQDCILEHLLQIYETQNDIIYGLKEYDALMEVYNAHDYLNAHLPRTEIGSLEEAGKHWLDGMLLLKNGGFSYYASQEACDKAAFTKIDKTDMYRRYGLNVKGSLKYTNLPATWDDPSIKTWRLLDEPVTEEKTRLIQEREERMKQRETLKPYLVSQIRQGHSNSEIEQQLQSEKKSRMLIGDLMLDTDLLRLQGVDKHKPPKVEVTVDGQKTLEQMTQNERDKLISRFDKDVTALFPAGLSDQEIYDRVTQKLGNLDRDGTNGPLYQVFMLNDSDLLRGRIRLLRKTFDTPKQAPTETKPHELLDQHFEPDLYPPENLTLEQDFTETVTFGLAAGYTVDWLTRTIQRLHDSQGRSKYWTLNDMHDVTIKLEQAMQTIQTDFNKNKEANISRVEQKFEARIRYLIIDQHLTTIDAYAALTTGIMSSPKYQFLVDGPKANQYRDIINKVYKAYLDTLPPWNTARLFYKDQVFGTHKQDY